ncbi:lipopolysaccharide biosynthesis protein [Nodosilinea sp. E11]|uniref:lipopolysaccharide biosynthesis protein n=1 Tax=Nodosilinea sp. E11 TaxID=3037479 RepID=UPI002934649C|nr:lipopolysaccharide biosynthesis protein [Nodosilinea sp. E11]WOD37410.1 lipopolysaccharide biosynthesis protein [Nodosilinea sp. E11]
MTSSNTVQSVAKSSLWLTISYGFSKALQLISQIFLARILTPEMFGVWGMVMVITTLAELFKDSAIAQVLVQRGLDNKPLADAVYSLGITISVIMFVAQSLLGYPLAQFFNEPIVWPLTAITALIFLVGAGAGSHGAVLSRRMQFRELAIADSGAGLARMGGAVVCASMGFGVWSFAIAEVARAIVDAGLKRWFSRYPFRYYLRPDPEAVRNVRSYISSLVGINLAVYANTNGDNLIVGRLLGAQALGFYSMAYQLAMLPAFALSQINRVNLAVISQRDTIGQQRYVCKMLELCALLSAPIYGVGFVIAPWLIPRLYGSEWTAVVPLFQVILIFAYSRGFMSILGTTLNALNKPQINAAINWVLVPAAVPAFLIGARWLGIMGVAIAAAGVMGIGASIWFWLATSRVMACPFLLLAKPVILPTGSAAVALWGATLLPDNSPYKLALQPAVLLLIYGFVLSVGSAGRIPQMLISLVRQLFKTEPPEAKPLNPR